MTLYTYKKKTTTFAGQGPAIGTPRQPVGFGGGGDVASASGGKPLPSGLFGQGSRSGDRGIPERIPPSSANPMGIVAQAVAAPAHTLERPLAILNVLTGGGGQQKGAVDHFLDAAGQIGFGSTEGHPGVISLGSLAGFAGTVLQRSNDLIPALTNANDARLVALTAKMPDSFVMTPEWLKERDFSPQYAGGGLFGIGSHPKTVGELRVELTKRGFAKRDDSLAPDAPGNQMSWDEVAQKVNDGFFGQFMFGSKAVNDNEMVNMASRLVFDPINLAFGAGVITKAGRGAAALTEAAARFAPWAADGAYKLSYAGAQALRPIRWGAGYAKDMAALGLRSEALAPVRQAARSFADGQVTGLSLKALGWAGRTYFMPGEGSLLRRYARGALRTEATLLGAEALTYPLTQSLQNVPIASGLLNGVHDMSKSFLEDKPLSENSLFVMASAFTFPVREFAGEARTGAGLRFKNFAGSNDLSMWAQKWGTSSTRLLKDPYGRIRGGEKEASILNAFGGEEGFRRAIFHVDLRLAYQRLIEHDPFVKEHFKSLDEAMARGSALADRVVELAQHMRDTGKIKALDRINTFEEWAKSRERTIFDEQGMPRTGVPEMVRFDSLTFGDMAEQWNAYDAIQAALHERFTPLAEAIVGRMGRLTQEDVRVLIAAVKAGSEKGRTPTSLVTSVMLKHPGMFEDVGILTPDELTFWKNFMTAGRAAQGDAPIGGQLSRLATSKNPTYDTGQLVAKLEGIAAVAPPAKELFGEAAMAESKVVLPVPEGGPLTAAGHRPIYSAARIREYRENAHAQAAAKHREYVAAEEQFNRDWTKTHGPRKGGPLDLNLQSRDVIVEPDRYDAIRRAGETFLDEGTHNLAEPTHFNENRAAVTAELYARVQEPWGGATYDPHTGEYVTAADATPAPAGPYFYHGTMTSAMPGISKSGMRSGSNWIVDAKTASSYAIGEGAPLYRAGSQAIGGIEKAQGWVEGGRVDPSKLEVSVDGGKSWSPVGAPAEGPYASGGMGTEVSLSITDSRDPAKFSEALDRLVESNKALLGHDDFYIGVFHDDALARVDMDVVMLTRTRDETVALQTALGNQHGGAYDFSTGNGVYGVNPDWQKYISERSRQAYPAISPEQADSLATVADVAARAWAKQTGRAANEFYAKFIGGIERGLAPAETALFQTMDALALGRRRGLSLDDVAPTGQTPRQMIEEPPPAVLTEAGMGEHAAIEWQKFPGTPVEVGIPGGMAGLDDPKSIFSLWDLWRLKAQAINPRLLPPAVAQKLYTKVFRSQVRSLETDSLDSFNRMVFALQSPNQNLLANEAIYSAIRARTPAEAKSMAGIYDEVINSGVAPDDPRLVQALGAEVQRRNGLEPGAEPKGQGVNTISSQIQMGNTVLLAKRYVEHPEFFLKKPEESMLEYVERLAAVTPGAGFKVSNFGVMVGDPIASTQGTLDSHMAELLGVGQKAPPAQSITYRLANGEINPRVPEHLRNLPEGWEPPHVLVFGGRYEAAHKIMEELYSKAGISEFGHGGYQWFRWDQKRGGLEPHTLIYPGAYKLPKMTVEARRAAFATQQGSGFRAMSALNFRGFRPSEGFLYQMEPRKVIRIDTSKPFAGEGQVSLRQPPGINELEALVEKNYAKVYPQNHDIVDGLKTVIPETGTPGIAKETTITSPFGRQDLLVSRAPDGSIQGVLGIDTESIGYRGIYVKDSLQRQGIATALYDKAEAMGYDIRTPGPKTNAGTAFVKSYLKRHPEKLNQGPARAPRGETEFVNDVKGIMRGFESADFSTAVHEWTHVYRRVLTDSPEDLVVLESHLGVVDGAWSRAHEEAFSKQLETYLSSGKASNPELATVFERFKVWLGELYAGIKGKRVTIAPEVKQVFDDLFSATKREEMWAPLRAEHQANLTALREGVKAARRDVRAIDKELESLRTVKIDPRFLDADGNPKVDPKSLEELQTQTKFLAQEYPAYDLEPAPALALQFRPDDSHLAALLTERGNLAHMVLNYGPLSKGLRIVEAMTSPVNSQKMARDARQMVFNKLIPLGATPKQVRVFFQTLSETGKDLTTTSLHQPLFRGITALPPNAISAALREATSKNEAFVANFVKKYGGMDRAHVMLDESYNSAVRAVDTKRLAGQRVGPIAAAFRAGYYGWQTLPILRAASDQTRFLSKVAYPFFRFQMDLRWQTLNMVEADLMAFFRDGFQATRFARRNDLLVPRGPRGKMIDISDNAAALHMSRAGVPIPGLNHRTAADIGSSPNLPRALADETGIQITNRHLYQVLKREFNVERPDTIMKVIDALPASDPTIALLIKKFGTDRASWADQVAETVYAFDSKGVRQTVQAAASKVRKFEKWTPTESAMMVPLVDKIIERNQRLMDDLLQVHIGNVNRSRLERVANSYWLYWPISYQIKAAKWMVKVMGDRAMGQKTNLGGAWDIDRMGQMFKQQVDQSEDFQKQLENSSPIWFMASMLLPIVPWDPGISLNRYVRYVGGNGLGLWKAYSGLNTAQDWALKFFEMGPIYTVKLAQQITDSLTQSEPTYSP